jgi:hypothetical protein
VRITDEQMIAATARLEDGSFTAAEVQAVGSQSMRLRFLIPLSTASSWSPVVARRSIRSWFGVS